MTTKLTYSMTSTDDGYVASCQEFSIESTGASPEQAIERLRKALERRLSSNDAVGPPSRPPPHSHVELVALARTEPSPSGPGDSSAAEEVL